MTPSQPLIAFVKAYRYLLSPWLGSGCRFTPSCSAYALRALETHGALAGTYLSLTRLARCHPWCEGGLDPVPPASLRRQLESSTRITASSPPQSRGSDLK